MRWSGKLGAKVFKDFAKDGHNLDQEEGRNRKGDANHDDRVGHGRLHLFAEAGARFEEARQTVENLREQASMLAGFHHADKKPVENTGVFRDRFVEGLTALHARCHVADDIAQIALPLWVTLIVERRHGLDERDTGLDHGRKLPGKENQVSFLDRPGLFPRAAAGGSLLLQ